MFWVVVERMGAAERIVVVMVRREATVRVVFATVRVRFFKMDCLMLELSLKICGWEIKDPDFWERIILWSVFCFDWINVSYLYKRQAILVFCIVGSFIAFWIRISHQSRKENIL